MLKQGSSDPTSPRREASLFHLPGSSEPGLFFQGLSHRPPVPLMLQGPEFGLGSHWVPMHSAWAGLFGRRSKECIRSG